MDQIRSKLIVAALTLLAACERPLPDSGSGRSAAASDSAVRAQPGYIIDSILPPEEALRRFRLGLTPPVGLDGPRTRDELLSRFMSAVRRGDRTELRRLTITRAEYAFLVYPELPIARPPYRQPPGVAWLLLDASTGGGLEKLASKAAVRFELLSYRCPVPPETQGALRLHAGCTIQVREAGAEKHIKLFGRIVERDGRWKFIGLDGDL